MEWIDNTPLPETHIYIHRDGDSGRVARPLHSIMAVLKSKKLS